MTEEELNALLHPIIDNLRGQIAVEDTALDATERKISLHEAMLARVSAIATKVPHGANSAEAAAFGIIDDCLAPVEARLERARTTIAVLDFAVRSPGREENESSALLADLISGVKNYFEQIDAILDPVDSAFGAAISDVQTKTSELSELVTETINDAITAANDLQSRLAKAIPDATAPVAQLIDDEFGAELQKMAEQADALISSVEGLVSGASNALDSSLGSVTDLLEEVNKLVQPLDPAFDAMEMLRG